MHQLGTRDHDSNDRPEACPDRHHGHPGQGLGSEMTAEASGSNTGAIESADSHGDEAMQRRR